jgi:NAD-binding of NADP-dependent 3-hydroxyisobutyrate dehydrogenase
LFLIVAGAPPEVARISPVLERLGQRLFLVGDDAGIANLMKLAANVLTALTLQSMGEVLALLRKGGVAPQIAFEVLTGSLFDGKVHKTYGGKIVESRYSPPGMTTPLASRICDWHWPRPSTWPCPCRRRAWFMTVSWQQSPAVGPNSIGPHWGCSPLLMQACPQASLLLHHYPKFGNPRINRLRKARVTRGKARMDIAETR